MGDPKSLRIRLLPAIGAAAMLLAPVVCTQGQVQGPAAPGTVEPAPAPPSEAQADPDTTTETETHASTVDRASMPRESLPLGIAPAGTGAQGESSLPDAAATGPSFVRTLASLGLVLGVILAAAALARKFFGLQGALASQMGAGGPSPAGVMEVLGRYPVARGLSVVLLKVDQRVILLSHAHAGLRGRGASLSTLSTFDDPEQVASLLVRTRDEQGESIASRFRTLLTERWADGSDETDASDEPLAFPAPGSFEELDAQRPEPARLVRDEPEAVSELRRRLGAMEGGLGA